MRDFDAERAASKALVATAELLQCKPDDVPGMVLAMEAEVRELKAKKRALEDGRGTLLADVTDKVLPNGIRFVGAVVQGFAYDMKPDDYK